MSGFNELKEDMGGYKTSSKWLLNERVARQVHVNTQRTVSVQQYIEEMTKFDRLLGDLRSKGNGDEIEDILRQMDQLQKLETDHSIKKLAIIDERLLLESSIETQRQDLIGMLQEKQALSMLEESAVSSSNAKEALLSHLST